MDDRSSSKNMKSSQMLAKAEASAKGNCLCDCDPSTMFDKKEKDLEIVSEDKSKQAYCGKDCQFEVFQYRPPIYITKPTFSYAKTLKLCTSKEFYIKPDKKFEIFLIF